jgi:membrane-bound lytic murein transglycosylase D
MRSSRWLISAAAVLCGTTACAGRAAAPAVPAVAVSPVSAEPTLSALPLPEPPESLPAETIPVAAAEQFTEQRSEPAPELLDSSNFVAPIATPQTTATVSQDLRLTVHDIDIPLNNKVLSYVEMFTGRLKGYLEEGLSRGARFLPMIQAVFRAEGLPLDLAYVPLIESAFKPTAVSRAKARGIWQFMRGTALENGLITDWYIDERSDPEKATYAAARYLKTLHEMFGDWHLALAAYNGGPGRLQRAIRSSGRPDLWKLVASTRYLPRETREYVPLILAAVIIAKNPARYGLTVDPPSQLEPEDVLVASPVDLRLVAEWAGVPVETIQELNPELRRWTTPVRATEYLLKVPAGTGDFVRTGLQTTPSDALATFSHHTVKKGETISSIAKKLKVTRADLAEANYLSTRAKLQSGQRLIVPRAPTSLAAARTPATTTPLAESGQPDAVLASNVSTVTAESTPEKILHRVKRGETLSSIARLYRTTVTALKEWNRIKGNLIQAGQRLTVFAPPTVATN